MVRKNKKIRYSREYEKWLDNLEEKGSIHPKYNSSNGKYYADIFMELLKIQKGCCAYTEKRLCQDATLYQPQNWVNGKYQGKVEGTYGELEHFDESLKPEKGWLWSNFFVIDEKVNKNKGSKPVDYILKPDQTVYSSDEFLHYHYPTHRFVPNPRKSDEEKLRIKDMIKVLGLNLPSIKNDRKEYLGKSLKKDCHSSDPIQYFTAFRMLKSQLPN